MSLLPLPWLYSAGQEAFGMLWTCEFWMPYKALSCACANTPTVAQCGNLRTRVNWVNVLGISVVTTECPLSFPRPEALWHVLEMHLYVVCVWVGLCRQNCKLHRQWVCKLEHLAEGGFREYRNHPVFLEQVCFEEPPGPLSSGLLHRSYTNQEAAYWVDWSLKFAQYSQMHMELVASLAL